MKPVRGPKNFEQLSWKARDYSPMEIAEFARRIAEQRRRNDEPLFDRGVNATSHTERNAFADIISEVIEKTSSVQVTSATYQPSISSVLKEPEGGSVYYLHCVVMDDKGDLKPYSPTIAVHPENFPDTNQIAFMFDRQNSPLIEMGQTIERMMMDYLRQGVIEVGR